MFTAIILFVYQFGIILDVALKSGVAFPVVVYISPVSGSKACPPQGVPPPLGGTRSAIPNLLP